MRSRNLKTILPPPIVCASLAALLIAACSLIQEMPKEFMDTYGNIAHVEKVEYEGLAEGGGDTPRVTETRDFRIIYTIGNPGDFDLAPEFSFEGGDAEIRKIETEKRRVSLTVSGASLGTLEDGAALKVRLLLYMASQKILQSAYEIDMLYVRTGPPAGADPSNPGGSGGSQGGVDPSNPGDPSGGGDASSPGSTPGEDPSDPEPEEPVPPGNIVYVRGKNATWYESEMPDAEASDENSGDEDEPFATVQRAVDEILARNDGEGRYEILIDGTLEGDGGAVENGMADFSALGDNLILTIKGLSETATLDAGAKGRVVNVAGNCELNLTLKNLVLRNGTAPGDKGGGVYFENGTFVMENCEITENDAGYGGGVYLNIGTLMMKGCEITGNDAEYLGGGIYVEEPATLTMTDCKVDENKAKKYGGGIFVDEATLTIEGGTISENEAEYGGGVYINNNSTLTMNGGDVSENNATYGGGIYVSFGSTLNMSGGEISKNNANGTDDTSGGGGVYVVNGSKFNMSGGTLSKNTSAKHGGGVYVSGGTFTMNGSAEITGNKADSLGGGVYADTDNFTMESGTINGNTAKASGGGVDIKSGKFTMSGGTIGENTATANYGGGVSVSATGIFNMTGGTIEKNNASSGGGGVFVDGDSSKIGKFTMSGSSTISENTVKSKGGGGVHLRSGNFTMISGTIEKNNATTGGGVHVTSGGSEKGIFTMSGGSIIGNIANGTGDSDGGGGVCVTNGNTFNMDGGTIDGNKTANNGNGVCIFSGTFTMSGDAKVTNAYVYLANSTTIQVDDTLSAEKVATITLPDARYAPNEKVLSAVTGVTIDEVCNKFDVKSNDSTEWIIMPSGSYGVLAKANASGDVGVDVPEYDGYEFEVRDNENTEIVEKDTEKITLKRNYSIRLISVTKGENSLTGTFTLEIRDSAGNTLSREGSLCSKTNTSLPIEVQVPTVLVKMEAQVYVEAVLNDGKRINKTYQVTIEP